MRPLVAFAFVLCGVAASVGLVVDGQTPARDSPAAPGFRVQQLDDGISETTALADLNNDGRPDVISSESWHEAPLWVKHPLRRIPVASGYIDNFSDLPVDVNEDGFVDIVQIEYFARRLLWLQNPGGSGDRWVEHEIDAVGPTEFAFLVDVNNDGRVRELLPQFTGRTQPLAWYEFNGGAWVRHAVSPGSHGHGIGAGDINADGRADIVTPEGWLEAPAIHGPKYF